MEVGQQSERDVIRKFGPHLAYAKGEWVDTSLLPDRQVKTHCCFCGQQCGMILKAKGDAIIGIEPWADFPFNRGMLCPKGVKRYLQQAHPDRLLHPLKADPQSPEGFQNTSFEQTIDEGLSLTL